MNTIPNPSVPFNLPIPGGMCTGKMVTVQGTVPLMSQRFAVNLINSSGDIALHVCPKFRENHVARNTVTNMSWGREENHGTMPIYPGQNFEIIIMCEAYDFKIAFNGRHFTEFSHRLPLNTITNIAVDGDVVVFGLHFKEPTYKNNNGPSSTPYGFQTGPAVPNYNSNNLYPSNPYPGQPNSGSHYNPMPNAGGGSLYPQQPNYGHQIPHQGPYPQVPSPNPGGYPPTTQTSHTKPGLLDQAGMALAGILGPGLLAGGIKEGLKPSQTSSSYGKTGILDQAGRALAGVFGGSGLAGIGKNQRDLKPNSGMHQMQPGFLGQAGSALAGVFGVNSLLGGGSSDHHKHNKVGGVLGGTLGTAIAGAALTGHLNPIKAAKKQRKAQKKALKYGLPLAGAGLGAYALHKGIKKGFHRSSSSSSCSSSD